ncbi:MAG TPA: hypothetical protein VFN67_21285 [Polyangiales bacterium]|jgi:hypothetical protein|nr:hypothetical protein [Polyangiales bacterium]
MGRQHRVTKLFRVWTACAVLLGGGALCACSEREDPKEQIRRDVLRSNNLADERRKRIDAIRTTDDKGNLLPSDTKVAGVVLPRGYEPKFLFEYEWYYDGEKPFALLDTYIKSQLDYADVQRQNNSALTYVQARTKGDSQMKPVSVTISPVPGREDWSRLQIVAQRPKPQHLQTKEEIEAELSLRKQNAQ